MSKLDLPWQKYSELETRKGYTEITIALTDSERDTLDISRALKQQRDLYLKKVTLDFDLLQKLIDKRRVEVRSAIYKEFDLAIASAEQHLKAYSGIKQRMNYLNDYCNRINEIGLVEKYKV
jgi:hypothetical protein